MSKDSLLQKFLQLAEHVCEENNCRLTQKRRQVLTVLLQVDKAISAYELIDNFKAYFNIILSPMTAYRSLEFLERMQLAHRLNTANKYIACAHIGSDFSHELPHFLICKQCLRVDELKNHTHKSLHDITNKVEQTGYQLSSPQIELTCICNACLIAENLH